MAERKLSTRDKKLRKDLMLTPEELAKDIESSQTEYNINMLIEEISRAKTPAIKKILMDEHTSIMASIAEKETRLAANKVAAPKVAENTVQPASLLDTLISIFNR